MCRDCCIPSSEYSIKRGQIVPGDNPLSAAWHHEGEVVSGQAKIPCASGKGWDVEFDALSFRGTICAFFHASPPASKDHVQLCSPGIARTSIAQTA
jgi:hypothetical protein